MKRRIFVTSALPYANGKIHLGHLLEAIQTDIWVRFLKMQDHEVYYCCADDAHGTPIMLSAEKAGIMPEQLVERVGQQHQADFHYFTIGFDAYVNTHSTIARQLSEQFYSALQKAGLIELREIEQYFDPVKNIFLPDRYIKGGCPRCSAPDQYGDNCEVCGALYAPTELKQAYSAISGAKPVRKKSLHYFFCLSQQRCRTFLRSWISGLKQAEVRNKAQEWLGKQESEKAAQLNDWDISRDAPYFGFKIPNTEDKYFYVWLDAPIGYYASLSTLCAEKGLDFAEWVKVDSPTEQYHFIGKDILYFHTLFWPAMLHFSGHRSPSNVFAHGFLTIDGQKMSKSRGTFITADSYIQTGLNSEYLRYYLATKMNGSMEDVDFNLDDFLSRINSDLVGKTMNIASRCAGFLIAHFSGKIDDSAMQQPLVQKIRAESTLISQYFEQLAYSKALKIVMTSADWLNAYIDTEQPWVLAKRVKTVEDPSHAEYRARLHQVCSIALEGFRLLMLYLKPVLPVTVAQAEQFLQTAPLKWEDVARPLCSACPIHPYPHLMQRIQKEQIDAWLQRNRAEA